MLKYQSQTPLNNQYTLKNLKDRKVKQFLSQGGHVWEGEDREGKGG
jgi:hypothetical protein